MEPFSTIVDSMIDHYRSKRMQISGRKTIWAISITTWRKGDRTNAEKTTHAISGMAVIRKSKKSGAI